MRRLVIFVLQVLIFVVMLCSVAFAQDAAGAAGVIKATALSQALTEVVKIVGAALMLVVGWLVKKGVVAFEAKIGMDISTKEEALVNEWVDKGYHLAEEKALQWIKDKASKPIGGAKLETAFDFVWDQIQEMGLVGWTREMVLAKIEAVVNSKRANVVPASLP
jgi:hypothetical protein